MAGVPNRANRSAPAVKTSSRQCWRRRRCTEMSSPAAAWVHRA